MTFLNALLIIADINECQEIPNGNCDHNCTNIGGSYCCSCLDGYILDVDDASCIGMTLYVQYVNK